MEIGGLPLHALVVHAAVVLTPLAALVLIAFAVWPRHRWLTRWPAGLLVLAALGSVLVARVSGSALVTDRPELAPLVTVHRERANVLTVLMVVLVLVTALALWALPGPSALASGRGARESRSAALDRVVPAVVVAAAIAVLVAVVLVGDSGARAVWG